MCPEYWVEADKAVLDHSRVIGYSVWRLNNGRECIKRFSANRRGGWQVALLLAKMLRDDLNQDDK